MNDQHIVKPVAETEGMDIPEALKRKDKKILDEVNSSQERAEGDVVAVQTASDAGEGDKPVTVH